MSRGSRGVTSCSDGGPGDQAADEDVPHYPAGGGEPKEAVLGTKVEVQHGLLQRLEQDAAMAVDHPPWESRWSPTRTRPTTDGRRAAARTSAQTAAPSPRSRGARGARASDGAGSRRGRTTVSFSASADRRELLDLGHPPELMAAETVAVRRQQHRGLHLQEAVKYRPGAGVGGAARPRCGMPAAQAKGDRRLGDVGHVEETTRSPRRTPSSRSPRCAAPTRARSAAALIVSEGSDSDPWMIAGRSSSRRSRCSAKFSSAPSNQRAPGIVGCASTAGSRCSRAPRSNPRSTPRRPQLVH